jgi:hypothetical protein
MGLSKKTFFFYFSSIQSMIWLRMLCRGLDVAKLFYRINWNIFNSNFSNRLWDPYIRYVVWDG